MPNTDPLHTGAMYPEPLTPPDHNGSDDSDSVENGRSNSSSHDVWGPDVEQSFQEALAIYPPCGRRKVNLRHGETGRMYGRNELISRYIKLRTGKTRSRKQVSSHIQVIAKRRARGFLKKLKVSRHSMEATPLPMPCLVSQNQIERDLPPSFSSEHIDSLFNLQEQGEKSDVPSSAHIRRATVIHDKAFDSELSSFLPSTQHGIAQTVTSEDIKPFGIQPGPLSHAGSSSSQPCGIQTLSSADINPFSRPCIPQTSDDIKPFYSQPRFSVHSGALSSERTIAHTVTSKDIEAFVDPPYETNLASRDGLSPYEREVIVTNKLKLVEFSAFVEQSREPDNYHKHLFVHVRGLPNYAIPFLEAVDIRQIYDKFPEKSGGLKELFDKGPQDAFFLIKVWADLDIDLHDDAGAFYGFTSQYEGALDLNVICSIKVCSFGKEVVEKVICDYVCFENDRFVFKTDRLRMCEYMIRFIQKLKYLPENYMINSVLENFTILQTVTDRDSQETLLCISYVFEVSKSGHETHHHIYRLVKN